MNANSIAIKTALITGASAGIGRELAELFARDHYQLVLVARDEERLLALAHELLNRYQTKCIILKADLSQPGAPSRIREALTSQNVRVDVLVNNAGMGTFGLFVETDPSPQIAAIDINIRALTELTRIFLPDMIQKGSGRILNVASTAAFQPGPLMAVYYATKAYVLSFSEALYNELEGSGVTVTALCPGPTATEFQQRANINISKLKKSGWLMGARPVAEAGYRGMHRGKRLVIPGFINLLIAESVRFTPRFLVLKIARMIQNQAKTKVE